VRRLVIVGGGISGLAAAWRAQRAGGGSLEVVVLEREGEVGGKARSIVRDGWLVEGGPSGFLGDRPEMDRLIQESGLDGERVPAQAAAAHRFLFLGGRMREVAAGPAFLTSGILGVTGIARMLAEPFIPRRTEVSDESVWQFAARRLGPQVADRLIAPMTLGIFAGDAKRLSVQAAFPRMTALEHQYGSIIKGMFAKRGNTSSGALTSFRGGMQALPRRLAERGGFTVRCGAEVRSVRQSSGGWEVALASGGDAIAADAVLLSGEPWAMAPLLRPLDAEAARELEGIDCPPVAVVGLGYRVADAIGVPSGFGVLIARGEGLRALGNLWESRLYPGRSPDGMLLIRAMFGGQVDPAAGTLAPAELVAMARAEFARLYGIRAEPVMEEVVRWARAIPQYGLGHAAKALRIERAAAALGGVFITGYGMRAIAFADAATNGALCGERAAEYCRSRGA